MGCISTKLQQYKLRNLSNDNTPFFDLSNKSFWAKCVDVYDGDTITIAFMLHKHPYKFKCRLANLDTAELRTQDQNELKHAKFARDRMKQLILNKVIYIHSGKWDKYGRLLIWVRTDPHGCLINELMIKENLGYYYDGKKKKTFSEWYLKNGSITCNQLNK